MIHYSLYLRPKVARKTAVTANKEAEELLRINVGFLLKQGAGYSREILFDNPGVLVVEDVQVANLTGSLCLTRTPQGIVVQGELAADAVIECVRCLTPFSLHFTMSLSDLFAFPAPRDADFHFIVDEGGYLDLRPIVREESILAVPIHALCRPDCKGLCPECGENLNETTCGCKRDSVDPRLAPLRALLDDDDS
jgi:uncharacterized protein